MIVRDTDTIPSVTGNPPHLPFEFPFPASIFAPTGSEFEAGFQPRTQPAAHHSSRSARLPGVRASRYALARSQGSLTADRRGRPPSCTSLLKFRPPFQAGFQYNHVRVARRFPFLVATHLAPGITEGRPALKPTSLGGVSVSEHVAVMWSPRGDWACGGGPSGLSAILVIVVASSP